MEDRTRWYLVEVAGPHSLQPVDAYPDTVTWPQGVVRAVTEVGHTADGGGPAGGQVLAVVRGKRGKRGERGPAGPSFPGPTGARGPAGPPGAIDATGARIIHERLAALERVLKLVGDGAGDPSSLRLDSLDEHARYASTLAQRVAAIERTLERSIADIRAGATR